MTVAGVNAKDGEVLQDTATFLDWKIYNAAPNDVLVDVGDMGTNLLQSCYIQAA
jgi:hypothetical protein